MSPFKAVIKDCLNATGKYKSYNLCDEFAIERDLLSETVSTFTLRNTVPSNTEYGDILLLYDEYGKVQFQGVIIRYEDKVLECNQIQALFSDTWLYRIPQGVSPLEFAIKCIIDEDFKNNDDPIMKKKYNFTITYSTGTFDKLEEKDKNYTVNFSEFLYSCYQKYGIRIKIEIPFYEGEVTLDIAKDTLSEYQVADNINAIEEFVVMKESVDTNKLIICSSDGEIRAIYYATLSGITTQAEDVDRLSVIQTKYVFSDDPLNDIVASNINEQLYNHKITFDLRMNNNIYKLGEADLGRPLRIYYRGKEYRSILTGYSIEKKAGQSVQRISLVCGNVRTDLSKKIKALIG